ncbi:MAG: hypothetical protein A2Z42_04365 [Candidatus Woykebacteria bacterium RBG_19FT_COMBO_43_10]|uniref:DUF192 domain-containing protein n=1 Tax=Candidatus Woykebacteria bacterium RBG_19FT_COMBO_43_10 TaxID=1802598 RepID=A0A1G1WFA2_9BACT|nr:MAG: hypothetical protein A2Z42_04365 [Candidatus Woykebacteria bacterium RBG_19FT_COMBO_43_10]
MRSIKFVAGFCKLCENRKVLTLSNFTNKVLIIVFGLLLLIFPIFIFASTQKKSSEPKVGEKYLTLEINGTRITAEIAKTPREVARGLSGRDSLGETNGMLFYLGSRRNATFWMKDMKFPIDIIWIDKEIIVYIVENAPVPTQNNIPAYTPDKLATHVLEVNAGFVSEHNIRIGDSIEITGD